MSEALARLQASDVDTRAQRTVPICLAQGVVKQVQRLVEEREGLEIEIERGQMEGQPVAKMGAGASAVARRDAIVDELEELYDVMREHTGHVTIAATITAGEWQQFKDANPAREEGRDDNGWPIYSTYDLTVAGGFCNASALIDRVGDFVTEWEGEPLGPGQWEWLRANMAPGDLKPLAREIIAVYEGEGAKALPKSSSGSSGTPTSTDS